MINSVLIGSISCVYAKTYAPADMSQLLLIHFRLISVIIIVWKQ